MKHTAVHYPVHRDRIFFAWVLLVLVVVCAGARQDQSVEVRPADKTVFEIRPGSILALAMRVTNMSQGDRSFESKLDLPAGWRPIAKDLPFTISPGNNDLRLLTFSIPSETPAGTYRVSYKLKDRDSGVQLGEGVVQVIVREILQLELRLSEAPRFAVAGRQYSSHFFLVNKGNTTSRIKLSTRSTENFPSVIESSIVILAAQEARSVEVKVVTSPLTEKVQHTVELFATFEQDTMISFRASSVVEVVPQVARSEDRYLELPLYVRLRSAGENNVVGGQVEIAGYGSFNEDRSDRFQFLIRSPETQTRSALGQRDEYKVSYKTRGVELFAGDWNYSLTPLTEIGRYGTGAGANMSLGGINLGGFYNETRFLEPRQKQLAAFLNYDVTDGLRTAINYLKRTDTSDNQAITLRSISRPFLQTDVDAEIGFGSTDTTKSDAYSLRLSGNQRWVSYEVRFVRADATFPGYYRDLDFTSAGLTLQASKNIRLEAYYRDESRNLARDTNRVYAPRDRYFQLGMAYSSFLSLYYRTNNQEDLMPQPHYSRRENVLQARLGYNFTDFSMFANADFGTTQDRLQNKPFPSISYSLNTSVRPIPSQSYAASIQYAKDQSISTNESQERLSGSLTAFLFLGQATQIQSSFFVSRTQTSFRQTYALFELMLEHIFPSAHKITVKGRQSSISPSSEAGQTAYHLEYAIPLGIPLKRLTTNGQISGRVIDEAGRGIEGVLLNAGPAAALTDDDGRFLFPSLSPGVVFLHIDRASIGLDKVALQLMPMEVVVRGGDDAHVGVTVVRSSFVLGTVTLFGQKNESFADSSGEIVEIGGRSGIFVELRGHNETLRRVTDSKGRFGFADLRPGKWMLKVVGGDVPLYHALDQDSFDLEIQSGQKSEISFKILPRKRQIRIIQEGAVIEERKPDFQPKTPDADTLETCLVFYSPARKGYVIQLSSWLTKSKAEKLAKDAKTFIGRPSYVESAYDPKLGRRYRVRVGPFKTKEEAEEKCRHYRQSTSDGRGSDSGLGSQANVQDVHHSYLVVFSPVKKAFSLQHSSWLTESKAKRVAGDAERTSGLPSFMVTSSRPEVGKRIGVRVGIFKTKDEAQRKNTSLTKSRTIVSSYHSPVSSRPDVQP